MTDWISKKMNKNIGSVIKEKMSDKIRSDSIAEMARRITMEYCEISAKENEKLKEDIGELTEEIKQNYYKMGAYNIDKIQIGNEEKSFVASEVVSYTKMQRYLSGDTPIPIWFLVAFCTHCEISLDKFMSEVFEKFNKEELFWEVPLNNQETQYKNYLESEFGENNDSYIYNIRTQAQFFKELFKKDKNELKYNTLYFPFNNSEQTEKREGNLTFYNDTESQDVCRVDLRMHNKPGAKLNYNGFAMLVGTDTDIRICWCFLRHEENSSIVVICFRLGTSKGAARIAEVLTCEGSFRMLLSEESIKNEKDFEKHLKTTQEHIIIDAKDYHNIKNFLDRGNDIEIDKETLGDLNKHFSDIDDDDKITFAQVIKAINPGSATEIFEIDYEKTATYGGLPNRAFLFGNPLILSWLQKHSISNNYSGLNAELDKKIEDIYEQLLVTQKK